MGIILYLITGFVAGIISFKIMKKYNSNSFRHFFNDWNDEIDRNTVNFYILTSCIGWVFIIPVITVIYLVMLGDKLLTKFLTKLKIY